MIDEPLGSIAQDDVRLNPAPRILEAVPGKGLDPQPQVLHRVAPVHETLQLPKQPELIQMFAAKDEKKFFFKAEIVFL